MGLQGCRSTRWGQETKGLKFSPVGVSDVTQLFFSSNFVAREDRKRGTPQRPRAPTLELIVTGAYIFVPEGELLLGQAGDCCGQIPETRGSQKSRLLGTPWPGEPCFCFCLGCKPTHTQQGLQHTRGIFSYIIHILTKVCLKDSV